MTSTFRFSPAPETTNRLFAALLFIGMLLSPTLQAEEWVYTTRPGDTIWDISKTYLKSVNYWARVQELNNVDVAKQLSPGTRLRIPLEWLKNPAASATVVSVTGDVSHVAGDTSQQLSSKKQLAVGDMVKTAANSSALVQFADGSTLLIQQNTTVKFNAISSYGKTGMVDTRIRLQQGRVETSVKPLRDPVSRYQISTPAAVAAVRGTQFRVAYENNDDKMGSEVVEGDINVAADAGQQDVKQGFGTITEKGQPPLEPVKLLQKPILQTTDKKIRYLPYTFGWQGLEGAQQYRIQISPQQSPDSLSYESLSSTNKHTLEALEDGHYILRIRGIDKLSLEGFSSEHIFEINTRFPTVKPRSPASQDELDEPPYTFSWEPANDIETYYLQVATDPEFNNIVLDQKHSQAEYISHTHLTPGQYYWRVAAIDQEGNLGKYSEPVDFVVDENNYEFLMILLYILPAFLI